MKKISWLILIIVIAAGGGSYLIFRGPAKQNYESAVVKRQNVVQQVNVSGKVKPSQAVDLAFEKSGRVALINFSLGQTVQEKDILIELENGDLKAQILQAQAQLESAYSSQSQYQAALEVQEAKLKELKQGSRQEEIAVSQSKVAAAQKSLSDAQTNLANAQNKAQTDLDNLYDDVKDILSDGYTKSDDAVNKQIAEFFSNANTSSPKLTFSLSDSQIKNDVEWQRALANDTLSVMKTKLNLLPKDPAGLDKTLQDFEQSLNSIQSFLARTSQALNVSINLTQSAIYTYQGYVNAGRTNLNTALTDLNNQKQLILAQKSTNQQNIDTYQGAVNTAKNNLDLAEKELTLKLAGATAEQIAGQEALVKQAQANLQSQSAQIKQAQANIQNIQAQLVKTMLASPIKGIVSKIKAKVGEIMPANTIAIAVISENEFDLESNIPEVDIAKVKIGDAAQITLDAYGDDIYFEAKVASIEPTETIVEGLSTYKTNLVFLQKDERIKSGMTADIEITTALKENIIAVPMRAVVEKNGEKIVRVVRKNDAIEERKVQTGLRGSKGTVEITEGLAEGEEIIVFTQEQ